MEMQIGSFDSICSANVLYWRNGKRHKMYEHSHSRTIDNDNMLIMAGSTASGAATFETPERLFCSQHHERHDPFGYIAQSESFTVNGGLPF